MKTAIICPIPDLERFVTNDQDYHLLLAHLFDHPKWGGLYKSFYRERSDRGDFITLDNGAKELGSGLPMEQLLRIGIDVGASELVVPDVRYECIRTIDSGSKALWWLSHQGQKLYQEAGKPKLMVVPQGKSIREWRFCLQRLLEVGAASMSRLGGPPITVGVAYHYDHLFKQPFTDLVHFAKVRVGHPEKDVHLLGWTRRLETLRDVAEAYPNLRSVDSSRPLVYAMRGLLAGQAGYPNRGDEFFFKQLPLEIDYVAKLNIRMFQAFANGAYPCSVCGYGGACGDPPGWDCHT